MGWLSCAIFWVAFLALLFQRMTTLLLYFQQEEYNQRRFFDTWKRVKLYDVLATAAILVFAILGFMLDAPSVATFFTGLALGLIAWREHKYIYKKPLVKTERAMRIRNLALGVTAPFVLLVFLDEVLAILMLQSLPLSLIAANTILQPIQQRINDGFVSSAIEKLRGSDLATIGVTGSFGKTTVKHILAELLEMDAPVFYSKGSINTKLGLTRHIRKRLQPAHKYFIAEMGAYKLGSIEELCQFARPEYGIVTAVGHAHTERFGSVDVIARAKSELAEWVCHHGKKLITTEAVAALAPFQALREQYPDKFCVVGRGEGCDVRLVSAELDGAAEGAAWQISAVIKKLDARVFEYDIPLLGEHNVLNTLLAVALVAELSPSLLDNLPRATRHLSQIPHRLQSKMRLGLPLILDDAYNSNETGFRNAVSVLSHLAKQRSGKAILVTPGIAELGHRHDEVHASLGQYCNDYCDVVYVVNPARIDAFAKHLDGSRLQVIPVDSFREADKHIQASQYGEQDVILYENDLPDVLEETRFL